MSIVKPFFILRGRGTLLLVFETDLVPPLVDDRLLDLSLFVCRANIILGAWALVTHTEIISRSRGSDSWLQNRVILDGGFF